MTSRLRSKRSIGEPTMFISVSCEYPTHVNSPCIRFLLFLLNCLLPLSLLISIICISQGIHYFLQHFYLNKSSLLTFDFAAFEKFLSQLVHQFINDLPAWIEFRGGIKKFI